MYTWFECKVRYEKIVEGKTKKVTEPYLIEAFSYTEAEARVMQELSPYISGDYSITNIKRAKIAELFPNDLGDRWYTCKINIILLDESRGIEKKVANYILVQASAVLDAWQKLEIGMKGTLSDYVVVSIGESPIIDIFPYKKEEMKQVISSTNVSIEE
ncbi:MAG: DUF4494 domain-containing protein [Paludibacteraceae bacterium]|jgi:hypothetical protein|nr:DUF4494 domain-containing protein [Paludibacteraceae bacterium]MBP6609979.1 DUF4494 domain-containing protein [Paludibacter sp.]NLK92523.1 DUF4494 domain-containing protein [Bacteroidales bacterium]MBP7219193.1 DUF4494 domain-containing protein [Paludibacteraceae bacterium]MBP8628126.1 DUF4494 domain-containing protein [Paludibacteraceae bacterium]